MATLIKSVMLKIVSDDGGTELKLDRISAKADELGAKHPELKVRIDTAAASAKIAVLRAEMKDLGKASDSTGGTGLLGKLLFGLGGFSGFKSNISDASGIMGTLGAVIQSPAGLGAVAAVAGAGLVEITGLVSGFAAAGAGVGAFGILAIPTFKHISGAVTQLHTDQQAYNRATTAAAKSVALKHIAADWAALDPAERSAVKGVDQFGQTYSRMAKAFQPAVMKVFNDGLKLANTLLPYLKPFADAAATAIDGLLKQAGKFAGSKGFKDWLAQFQKLEGPSIAAIGQGIGSVAIAIGKLLVIMSRKDVVTSINIAFKVLSGTISFLGVVIKTIMFIWDGLSRQFHAGIAVIHSVASAVSGMRARVAADISGLVSRVESVWNAGWGRVVSVARSLPGRIVGALGNLGSLLFRGGVNLVMGLVHGIESVAMAPVHALGSIVSGLRSLLPFSPAKKGPLSGAGSPDIAGRKVGLMFAAGISGTSGTVAAAAARMAGAAGMAGQVGAAGARGGPPQVVLQVHPGGSGLDAMFRTWLKQSIRANGGNPAVIGR